MPFADATTTGWNAGSETLALSMTAIRGVAALALRSNVSAAAAAALVPKNFLLEIPIYCSPLGVSLKNAVYAFWVTNVSPDLRFATLSQMKNSPSPVPDTAQLRLLAYVPTPMIGESPTRP